MCPFPSPPHAIPHSVLLDLPSWCIPNSLFPTFNVYVLVQATLSLTWSTVTDDYWLSLHPHLSFTSITHKTQDGFLTSNMSPSSKNPKGNPTTLGIPNELLTWPQNPAFPHTHFLFTYHTPVFSQVFSKAKWFVLRAFALTCWAPLPSFSYSLLPLSF